MKPKAAQSMRGSPPLSCPCPYIMLPTSLDPKALEKAFGALLPNIIPTTARPPRQASYGSFALNAQGLGLYTQDRAYFPHVRTGREGQPEALKLLAASFYLLASGGGKSASAKSCKHRLTGSAPHTASSPDARSPQSLPHPLLPPCRRSPARVRVCVRVQSRRAHAGGYTWLTEHGASEGGEGRVRTGSQAPSGSYSARGAAR